MGSVPSFREKQHKRDNRLEQCIGVEIGVRQSFTCSISETRDSKLGGNVRQCCRQRCCVGFAQFRHSS